MVRSALLFDMQALPDGADPPELLYSEMLQMATYADRVGVEAILVGEHHSTRTGYNPTAFVQAAALAGVTSRMRIFATSVIALHNPLHVAEQIAVVDLISQGRLEVIFALGYSPAEFELFQVPMGDRVKRLERGFRLISRALEGTSFDMDGRRVVISPRPCQRPRPPFYISGGVDATARRAARLGAGFAPMVAGGEARRDEIQRLVDLYQRECRVLGREPGRLFSVTEPVNVLVSEDPERTWQTLEPCVRVTLGTYGDMAGAAGADSGTEYAQIRPEKIRDAGSHVVVTPGECIQLAGQMNAIGQPVLMQPLVGGLSPEQGWESLQLFAEKVLPELDNR